VPQQANRGTRDTKRRPPQADRYRAISFDAGETLVRPYPSFARIFRRTCAEGGLHLTPAQVGHIEDEAAQRLIDYQRRGVQFSTSSESSREFWIGLYREHLANLGVDGALIETLPERIYAGFTSAASYRMFADARPALHAARRRGLKVGVLSNWEPWLVRLLAELKIDHLLDFVVVSGICGYEKPDPRIYQEALAAAGVDPDALVHVGDSPHADVSGARRAGITPVLIDRRDRHPEIDAVRVRSLREIFAPGGLLDGSGDASGAG
jgi:putative hydrolase of the HAD superfamily